MGKKVEVTKCLHPIDQAFDQPREDGSGSVDKICGVCGFTMCEVLSPGAEAAEMIEPEGTADDDGMAEGDPSGGPEGGEAEEIAVQVACENACCPSFVIEAKRVGLTEQTNCNEHPWATLRTCPDFVHPESVIAKEEASTASPPTPATSYVTRDPDKISTPFTRDLPVPVPDEELAELAKRMSHTHGIWCKAKLDAKAAAKGFKGITDKAEEEMVELAAIIEAGTEERPVQCRWEFDYATGVKKLRRLDNWQIVEEETLTGDELHLSFDFQKQSEENVAKFFVQRETPEPTEEATEKEEAFPPLTEKEIEAINAEVDEELQQDPAPEAEPVKEASPYICRICGVDAGSHIYLVRHLRDNHAMKLSEYKAQFPA